MLVLVIARVPLMYTYLGSTQGAFNVCLSNTQGALNVRKYAKYGHNYIKTALIIRKIFLVYTTVNQLTIP